VANTAAHEGWVLSAALTEFAEDGEFDLIREIVDLFLSDTGEKIEALQNAVLACNIAGAQRIAHSLKGAARQMGLIRLADGAEGLERRMPGTDSAILISLVHGITERWRDAKQSIVETRDAMPCNRT
jgi:HPt (histidine-containing phosphotransfer) domain-containing protein